MAGGTLLTLAGSPVNFFHQGGGARGGAWGSHAGGPGWGKKS